MNNLNATNELGHEWLGKNVQVGFGRIFDQKGITAFERDVLFGSMGGKKWPYFKMPKEIPWGQSHIQKASWWPGKHTEEEA